MHCLRIALVLGAVLGAVGTEAVAQSTPCVLKVCPGPVLPGELVPFMLSNPAQGPMEYAVFVASGLGSTSVSTAQSTFVVPLNSTALLVAQGNTASATTSGAFIVPALPSLAGLLPRAAAVTWSAGTLRTSAAVPWGPILEDSLQ